MGVAVLLAMGATVLVVGVAVLLAMGATVLAVHVVVVVSLAVGVVVFSARVAMLLAVVMLDVCPAPLTATTLMVYLVPLCSPVKL